MENLLGEKIRGVRLKKGYSQHDAAKALGICPSYLCKVERGKRKPPIWLLAYMERTFMLEPGALDEGFSVRRDHADSLFKRRANKDKSV